MGRRSRFLLLLFLPVIAGVSATILSPVLRRRIIQEVDVALRWKGGDAKPVEPSRITGRVVAELVSGDGNRLKVPGHVVEALGIRTTAARIANEARSLSLSGSLALDANRLARVHPRFDGEVVEVGSIPDPEASTQPGETPARPLRFGDEVKEGQLLAVLWSTALGEKKSEYVDALSRLRLEQETLERLERLLKDQAIPERNVREAKRAVEADEIAVVRVERTLLSWRLTDEEIGSVKAEAEQMHAHKNTRDTARERSWARLEVRAPFAGTVVEKNVTVGDIASTTSDLFKIADLRRLAVWAHIYEEDLPILLALPSPLRWTVRLKSDPAAEPLTGVIEEIGDIIDPNQHTALVMGHVANPAGHLRAGQFIMASIPLPDDPGEVEIPTTALIEDGDESVVFVQPDPRETSYELRHVKIVRHTSQVAYVRSPVAGPGGEARSGAIVRGELVVSSGALELRASLKELQAAGRDSK
ncbi:efflux RND transporter periplasmic adaptor subunit [Tundrisphaera lichenicola]|uniref:efflux RND transporter periplasmic adaptor subunit n=1 Tax=Tundrisphaera lichenicola TaxID=2029860 RepID=UPI003EBC48E6